MAGGAVLSSTGSYMKLRSVPRDLMTMSGAAFAGVVLLLGILAVPAGAASPGTHVRPLACTDSWKTAASGEWLTAANWSTGVAPTSSSKVCITLAGTYKVTISGTALAGTIKLGGSSGKQTLLISGSPSASSILELSTATGSQITKQGVLEVDAKNSSGSGSADLYGPSVTIVNAGTFETKGGKINPDYLRASLTNSSGATTKIDGITDDDADGGVTTLTDEGTFSVGSAGILSLTGGSKFTHSGGTLTNDGTLSVTSGTFTQSGGTDSGNAISVISATLSDSAGAATFDLYGTVTLSGTIPSGQTVDAIGNPSYSTTIEPGANWTNDGTFELDSETVSGSGSTDLYAPSDTLTNDGTFETEGGTINPNYLRTSLTNASGGTTKIDGITNDDADGGVTTLTNKGTLSVGSADGITLSGGSLFTQDSSGTFSPTVNASTGVFGITGGVDTLAGTLDITTVGSPAVNNTYNVINNATSVTGTFSTVDGTYSVTYTTTDVTAKVT
jgi:hypothetical protein